jgi:superfamily I DNA and/or RNA helicase
MNSAEPLHELKVIQKAERRHRVRMASIAIPLLCGTILMLFYVFRLDTEFFASTRRIYDEPLKREPWFAVTALAMFGASGLGALMLYLQTGFRRTKEENGGVESSIFSDALNNLEGHVNTLRGEQDAHIESLRKLIQQTDKGVQNLREKQSISLDPKERSEFLSLLKEKLENEANSEVVNGLKRQWTLDLDRESQIKIVSGHLDSIKRRLDEELVAVNRRGNLNLSIGAITTVSGLLVLGLTVFEKYTGPSDYQSIILHYLPRISFVLLIEVFAYFFLGLYKASLSETRYFQNELTNVESRYTALTVALHRPQELGASATIAALASTERNFLLKAGETTVDIEALKIESDRQKGIISELRGLLKRNDDSTK